MEQLIGVNLAELKELSWSPCLSAEGRGSLSSHMSHRVR